MSTSSLLDIFRSSGALLEGHFKLTSGLHSNTYFQCAKVLQYPEYLTEICRNIASAFSGLEIDTVISPAVGGIVVGTEVGRQLGVKTIFAERKEGRMVLRRGFSVSPGEKVLVVEDVITTGGSAVEVIEVVTGAGAEVVGAGSVVDRSNGAVKLVDKQLSLLSLEVKNYEPDNCPLCKEHIPLDVPGSRTLQKS
ncbi:MAG: orotate phosphoribosyltransferase [Chlorobiales bacterium]|nr:orotate phosphoribosyltransferase [Chlorobiales bacterium]